MAECTSKKPPDYQKSGHIYCLDMNDTKEIKISHESRSIQQQWISINDETITECPKEGSFIGYKKCAILDMCFDKSTKKMAFGRN